MKGSKLDLYLSYGYFRMHQNLFTCRVLQFDDRLYTAHWLRLVLDEVQYGKKQLQVLKRNAAFTVTVKPLMLTVELESLYATYRRSIDFDASESVEACLFTGDTFTVFETYVVEVRDGRRLIAAGIFDEGEESIAGILNFYDPAYRRYSLGKFLMLQKIEHARRLGKVFYYPGYLVHEYPKFDYKLFPCEAATEVFDVGINQWIPFSWEAVAEQSRGILGLGE